MHQSDQRQAGAAGILRSSGSAGDSSVGLLSLQWASDGKAVPLSDPNLDRSTPWQHPTQTFVELFAQSSRLTQHIETRNESLADRLASGDPWVGLHLQIGNPLAGHERAGLKISREEGSSSQVLDRQQPKGRRLGNQALVMGIAW